MRYTTVALRPETRKRLERMRRAKRLSSMDAVVSEALRRMEMQETAAELRHHAKGWREAKEVPIFEEAAEALEGLDETVRTIRKNAGKNMRKRLARLSRP